MIAPYISNISTSLKIENGTVPVAKRLEQLYNCPTPDPLERLAEKSNQMTSQYLGRRNRRGLREFRATMSRLNIRGRWEHGYK